MSTVTYSTLTDAIEAHVQANSSSGLVLTNWVLYSYSTSMEKANAGAYQRVSSSMPPHTLQGLIGRLAVTASEEEDDDN